MPPSRSHSHRFGRQRRRAPRKQRWRRKTTGAQEANNNLHKKHPQYIISEINQSDIGALFSYIQHPTFFNNHEGNNTKSSDQVDDSLSNTHFQSHEHNDSDQFEETNSDEYNHESNTDAKSSSRDGDHPINKQHHSNDTNGYHKQEQTSNDEHKSSSNPHSQNSKRNGSHSSSSNNDSDENDDRKLTDDEKQKYVHYLDAVYDIVAACSQKSPGAEVPLDLIHKLARMSAYSESKVQEAIGSWTQLGVMKTTQFNSWSHRVERTSLKGLSRGRLQRHR